MSVDTKLLFSYSFLYFFHFLINEECGGRGFYKTQVES